MLTVINEAGLILDLLGVLMGSYSTFLKQGYWNKFVFLFSVDFCIESQGTYCFFVCLLVFFFVFVLFCFVLDSDALIDSSIAKSGICTT